MLSGHAWLWWLPTANGRGSDAALPGGGSHRQPTPAATGTVTEFERPSNITFHQPMTLRLHSGTVDVTLRYTLTPNAGSTRVSRVVTLGIPWSLRLLQPILVREFRRENGRTLLALKAYADEHP